MNELWRPVVGHESDYLVSNTGKVWNIRLKREITQRLLDKRYCAVMLRVRFGRGKGRQQTRKVHHLVAEAFIGPRPEGMLCCHKDDNRANNNANNLYWGTPRQNQADCTKNGNRPSRRGVLNTQVKLTEQQVREIRKAVGSQVMVGKKYNVSRACVQKIRNKLLWAHLT